MTTGDIKNNLRKLQMELKAVKYKEDVDYDSLAKGRPTEYLKLYHYLLVSYSQYVSQQTTELGVEFYAKSDLRFIEGMYKVLRELYNYKPPLTKDQFFSNSFAERKVIMATEIINQVKARHKQLAPRTAKPKSAPASKNVLASSGSSLMSTIQAAPTQPDGPPIVSKVVNEVRNPTLDIAESKAKPGLSSNKAPVSNYKPSVTVAQHSANGAAQTKANAYNPAAYGNPNTSPDRIDKQPSTLTNSEAVQALSRVEIIDADYKLDEDAGEVFTGRPIDVFPNTPAKSILKPVIVRETLNQPRHVDCAQQPNIENHLVKITESIKDLGSKLLTMEERLSSQEQSLHTAAANIVHSPPQVKVSAASCSSSNPAAVTQDQLETVLARLTLLENRMALIEDRQQLLLQRQAEKPKIHSSPPQPSRVSVPERGDNFVQNRIPIEQRNGVDKMAFEQVKEGRLKSPPESFSSSTTTHTTAVANKENSVCEYVSPIPRSIEKGESNNGEVLSSTPVEPTQLTMGPNKISEQEFRIRKLLQETERDLNIQLSSPAPANPVAY